MTDHRALFEDLHAVVEADNRFQKTHAKRYLTGFEPAVKSRFQRIRERHGLPIPRLAVRKTASVTIQIPPFLPRLRPLGAADPTPCATCRYL